MSMLTLNGQVVNVLQTPEGISREGKTYGGDHQIQLLCEELLKNGEKRIQLHTLRCEDPEPFNKLQGRQVRVPVGCFARENRITFFLERGATPQQHESKA